MDTAVWATLFGVAGNICSAALFLPNAAVVYRNRHDSAALRGVSVTMQVLILCNATLWVLYAWATGAWWAAAPGALNVPLALFVLHLVFRSRSRAAAGIAPLAEGDSRCVCGWSEPDQPHDLFCVTAAGYGTRRRCDGVRERQWGYVPVPQGFRPQPRIDGAVSSAGSGGDRGEQSDRFAGAPAPSTC